MVRHREKKSPKEIPPCLLHFFSAVMEPSVVAVLDPVAVAVATAVAVAVLADAKDDNED